MQGTNFLKKKAVFLVANGFCEREFIQAHKALTSIGINCRIVSVDSGLIQAWNEEKNTQESEWGAGYAPDALLSDCIASEYDILVIPGGDRSIAKLKLSDKVNAFLSAFMHTDKPVVAYNKGLDLLSFCGMISGYSVAAKHVICEDIKVSGARCAPQEFIVSKNLISLSRFRDADQRIQHAVSCLLNGEPYVEKVVSSDNMPHPHKAA
ncbi:MAG: DJ-1/PfpI family protein [Alphaproteobacteria bacterium]